MLIKSDTEIARGQAGDARSAHRQEIVDTVKHTTLTEVKDFETSLTNPERQRGSMLATPEFERRLRKILPEFITFANHPTNPSKKTISMAIPGGGLEFLMAYETPWMPEWSIMETVVEDVPDMSVERLTKLDVPKATWTGYEEGFVFDTSAGPLPGYKRVTTMGQELFRGWRVVLMKLVAYDVVTPAAVEAAFGISTKQEWAHAMGRYDAPTLWCQ
jgi:hypothetical protein